MVSPARQPRPGGGKLQAWPRGGSSPKRSKAAPAAATDALRTLAALGDAGFPSSASAPRPAGWRRSRRSSPAMPADTDPGMAFVLVQHLAPDHKSILTDLIRRYTRMQVFEVEDGMVVEAQLRLHHPAQPRHGLSERQLCIAGTGRAARPAPADRLLLPLPGPGPARAGHLHRALRHRQRRHPGACGRSRARAAWSWRRTPNPPSTTACRAAPSPPAWWTMCCRRPRCRPSSSPTHAHAFGKHHGRRRPAGPRPRTR